MKLVDILARELKVWPRNVFAITQDDNGALNGSTAEDPPVLKSNAWGGGAFYLDDPIDNDKCFVLDQADDYQSAEVTHAQWQTAVDALKADQEKVMIIGTFKPVNGNPYPEFSVLSTIPVGPADKPGFEGHKADKTKYHVFSSHWEFSPIVIEWTGEGLPPVGTVCELNRAMKFTEGSRLDDFPAGTEVLVGGHANFYGSAVVSVCVKNRNYTGTVIPECLRPIRTPEQIAAEERARDIAELKSYIDLGAQSTIKTSEFAELLYSKGYRKLEFTKVVCTGSLE